MVNAVLAHFLLHLPAQVVPVEEPIAVLGPHSSRGNRRGSGESEGERADVELHGLEMDDVSEVSLTTCW